MGQAHMSREECGPAVSQSLVCGPHLVARCEDALLHCRSDGLQQEEIHVEETTWDTTWGVDTTDVSDEDGQSTRQSSSSTYLSDGDSAQVADVAGFGAMLTTAAAGVIGRSRMATPMVQVQAFRVLGVRSAGSADKLAPVTGWDEPPLGEASDAALRVLPTTLTEHSDTPCVELWPPKILEYVTFDEARRFNGTCREAGRVLAACVCRDPPKAPVQRNRRRPLALSD